MRCFGCHLAPLNHDYHSLELNIRQLILSDLASNVGEVKDHEEAADHIQPAIDLITSRVETRAKDEVEDEDEREKDRERVFMVSSLGRGSNSFSWFSVKFASAMQYRFCGVSRQFAQRAC